MNIRLDNRKAVEVALDVRQRNCRYHTLDVQTLCRIVNAEVERVRKINLPEKVLADAEILVSAKVPHSTNNMPQTAVWLKYNQPEHTWYIKGIYRTSETLPSPRIKINSFDEKTAHKAIMDWLNAHSVLVDSPRCFALI